MSASIDLTKDPFPILERYARGRTSDGVITPERTLTRQREYNDLCDIFAPEVVRLAKWILAKEHLFAAGDNIVFDGTHGLMPGALQRAQEMLDFASGKSAAPKLHITAIFELRWFPADRAPRQ